MSKKLFMIWDNTKVRRIIFYSFILLVAGFFLYINLKMPLVGEDFTMQPWGYNSSPSSLNGKISAIFHTVYYSAILWSPRIGEALSTITSAFPKILFDVVNTILIIWLIIILFVLGYGRFPNSNKYFDIFTIFLIVLLLITLFPLLGQVFFWKTGACNHLWGLILILSFILPFRLNISKKIVIKKIYSLILYIILGFFAGLTIENVSAVVLGFLFMYYLISFHKNTIDRKFIFPLISNAFGVSILLFSPGTVTRRNYYSKFGYDGNFSGIALFLNRFNRVNTDFLKTTWSLLVVFFVCLIIYLIVVQKKKHQGERNILQNKSNLLPLIIMLLISYLSVLILITIPYQSDQRRGFSFFWLILISIIAVFVTEIWIHLSQNIRLIFVIICSFILTIQIYKMGLVYSQFYRENNIRMEIINSALENGETNITLHTIPIEDSRIIETRQILDDLGNRIASYYNFDSVVIEQ